MWVELVTIIFWSHFNNFLNRIAVWYEISFLTYNRKESNTKTFRSFSIFFLYYKPLFQIKLKISVQGMNNLNKSNACFGFGGNDQNASCLSEWIVTSNCCFSISSACKIQHCRSVAMFFSKLEERLSLRALCLTF